MKPLRRSTDLPRNNKRPVSGQVIVSRPFPLSQAGKEGPFPDPTAKKPNPGAWPDWVEYFVNLIGHSVETLNGLQFNLTHNLDNAQNRDVPQLMSDELWKLARELQVGEEKTTGPKELVWPLNGAYSFSYPNPDTGPAKGFRSFSIDLVFETDPIYAMVVNVSIEVKAAIMNPFAPDSSSSSSYIATSSK